MGYSVMSEGGKGTEAILYNVRAVEAVNDDALLSKDISQMDDEAKCYSTIRKRHAIARLLALAHDMMKYRGAPSASAPADTVIVAASVFSSDEEDVEGALVGEEEIGDEGDEGEDEEGGDGEEEGVDTNDGDDE